MRHDGADPGSGIKISSSSIFAQDFTPRAPDVLDINIDTDRDISGASKEIARLTLFKSVLLRTGWQTDDGFRDGGHTPGTRWFVPLL